MPLNPHKTQLIEPQQALLQRWWPQAPTTLAASSPAATAAHLMAHLAKLDEPRLEAVKARIEAELLASAVDALRFTDPEAAAHIALEGIDCPPYGRLRGYDEQLVKLLGTVSQTTFEMEAFGARLYHHLVGNMHSEDGHLEELIWMSATMALEPIRCRAIEERLLETRVRRHHEKGELDEALTVTLLGCPHPVPGEPPIAGFERAVHLYLTGRCTSSDDLEEAYAITCARLAEGFHAFRWHSRLKRYCLRIAMSASASLHRDGYRKRARRLHTHDHPMVAASRTRTRQFLRSSVKAVARQLFCENLPEEDWTIVYHRIYEGSNWNDIARVVLNDEQGLDEGALRRKSAQLRQHFARRIKPQLKELLLALTALRESGSST